MKYRLLILLFLWLTYPGIHAFSQEEPDSIAVPYDTAFQFGLVHDVILWNKYIPVLNDKKEQYGLNYFADVSAFNYVNDTALFKLKGYTGAGSVILSGSFNNWSTTSLKMSSTNDGWLIKIPLKPGRYLYKFIIDGHWISDPANRKGEFDGHGGKNSIVYCYNHLFMLKGFPNARRVYVSGTFNNWKKKELQMIRHDNVWVLPLFLAEGSHSYKFMVDNKWVSNPSTDAISNLKGVNSNSVIAIGDTAVFRLQGYQEAQKVVLAGSFNNWNENDYKMKRTTTGWEIPYLLGAGNYEYKHIVDGKWITDPANPNTNGRGVFKNSVLIFKPNYTFILPGYANASNVIITGSFNNWEQDSYKMTNENGVWKFSIYLKPGKHLYKFIVDRKWILDPNNPDWEENREGTGNSILWIEP